MEAWKSDTLMEIMAEEIELIHQYCRMEQQLKEHLFDKNWKNLEKAIEDTDPITSRINELETKRDSLFTEIKKDLGEPETCNFYQVIVHLPQEARDRLGDLYRELKFAVFKLQGITSNIDTYICSMKETMNHFLEGIFPHRKGKLYTKNGTTSHIEADPMIISRHL